MEIVDVGQAVVSLFFALLLVLVVFFVARRYGYFKLPPSSDFCSVSLLQTGGIFLTYLFLAFLVLPVATLLFLRLSGQQVPSQHWMGWAQVYSLFFVFASFLTYYFLMPQRVRSTLFWDGQKASVKKAGKALLMGCVSLAVSYPFVFLTGILMSLISLGVWGEAKVEQVAVKQLKLTMGYPALFSLMVFVIVILVPFMEELLFRGFLHNLLKRYLGRFWGVCTTAFIFALVHFAPSQGKGNLQLIASLFTLSLFLGFIYERERSLWAPLALHATFNGFSVLLIALA
ncbi:MAG: hypothetical protein S4CHLAM2_08230 [Chlamydiales bacterium]|nr:hypothetical protein [Chlamydiales bacterium]